MPSRSKRGDQPQPVDWPARPAGRLTLGANPSSSSTRRQLANTADIPSFTHPSSQSDPRPVKPLPKAQKEPTEPRRRPSKTAKQKGAGFASKVSKKQLEKAEEERKKREAPLEEAEEGEYDRHGFWIASQKETPDKGALNGEEAEGDLLRPEDNSGKEQPDQTNAHAGPSRLPYSSRVADTAWDDPDRAIAQALSSLNRMPSHQTFDDLLAADRAMRPEPAGHTQDEPANQAKLLAPDPQADIQPTSDEQVKAGASAYLIRSAPARTREAFAAVEGDHQAAYEDVDDPAEDETDGAQWIASHRARPEVPMPPPGQRHRSVSPLTRQPSEWRQRYLGPHVHEQAEYDEERRGQLSPTELNSSTILDPVQRPTTRRSNSHRQPYAIIPPSDESYTRTSVRASRSGQERASSFAVSETDAPTQRTERVDPSPPPSPVQQHEAPVKTYSKHTSNSSRLRRHRRISHADRAEAAFSPEPEWESQQRKLKRERDQKREPSRSRSRSKRQGSTSYWPETQHESATPRSEQPLFLPADDASADKEIVAGDTDSVVQRQPLGEVRVNERGRVVARGRGRNGAWPEDRQFGLFDGNDTQDRENEEEEEEEEDDEHEHERRRRRGRDRAEYYRPVSERFHLATRYANEHGEEDRKPRLRAEDDRIKAFTDRRTAHPIAKLKLKRSKTIHDGFDGYSSRPRFRYDRDESRVRTSEDEGFAPITRHHLLPRQKRKRHDQSLHLPGYVLKPIETISLQDYKEQQKARPPGDGFTNPVLIKAGRLGQRDAALRPIKRSRKSGGQTRSWIEYEQTPIQGEDGELDPIVPPTQTQRENSYRPQGFVTRQARKQRRRVVMRPSTSRPQLPFTSVSPRLEDAHQYDEPMGTAGLTFTSRQPPLRSSTTHVSATHYHDDDEDEEKKPVHPPTDLPQLAQPRVGFSSRFKQKGKGKLRNEDGEDITLEGTAPPDQELDVEPSRPVQGFARKVPGFWAPPPAGDDEWALIGGGDGGGGPQPQHQQADPPTTTTSINPAAPRLPKRQQQQQQQTPLFLPHSEESPAAGPSTGTGIGATQLPFRGMSGAQLCDDLLLRNSMLNIPVIPSAKSTRSAKRDQMANRVANKKPAQHKQQPVQEALFLDIDDEIEQDREEEETGPGYEPTSSQIRRRERFGFQRQDGEGGASRATQCSVHLTQGRSLPGMSMATQGRLTGQPGTTTTSLHSSDNHPPGNQEALHRPSSRAKSAISKGFVPPAPVQKPDPAIPMTSSGRPRWVTDNAG